MKYFIFPATSSCQIQKIFSLFLIGFGVQCFSAIIVEDAYIHQKVAQLFYCKDMVFWSMYLKHFCLA
jgi:hypothetical protein